MAMAHCMERFKKAVIAGDTCPDGVIYMFVLHQTIALNMIASLLKLLYFYLTNPRLYITSFYFKSMSYRYEGFISVGVRGYAYSGRYSLLTLTLKQFNYYLDYLYTFICV